MNKLLPFFVTRFISFVSWRFQSDARAVMVKLCSLYKMRCITSTLHYIQYIEVT